MQEVSRDVLIEKYCKNGETTTLEVFHRVARALASVENHPDEWGAKFYAAMLTGFIPAGRIMSAAGTDLEATLINCFVQPVGDAVRGVDKNGKPGIYPALEMAAETMRRGGGVGYDFSSIRPKGAWVASTKSHASGPISYMRVFDKSCETVESAGSRRGAQMGVLRIDHPDILNFIKAKQVKGELTNFNISVGITDAFMRAVEDGTTWKCEHSGVKAEFVARQLWDEIMRSTYDHAEPGVVFLDNIRDGNPLRQFEKIEATNPCGEQPLPDYGCCCLGSIDLTRFVLHPFTDDAKFSFTKFYSVVRPAVRMLDNVLDLTYWPLPEQKVEAMAKRRIGLGFTGLGDAFIMLGYKYGSSEAVAFARAVASGMLTEAYAVSEELGKEKGIPEVCKKAGIARRNSHLTSIAPTGTISLAFADNASNGIEPPFSWKYDRKKRMPDGSEKHYVVEDHAYRLYKEKFGGEPPLGRLEWVSALDLSVEDHLAIQAAVQPFVDSAISKTVNVPEDYPFEDFKELYWRAWKLGLKGVATYRPSPTRGAVLTVSKDTPVKPVTAGTGTGSSMEVKVNVDKPALALRFKHRPRTSGGNPSRTYWVDHPGGNFSITIGCLDDDPRPFEVWVNGVGASPALGALAKALSLDMRVEDPSWLSLKLAQLKDYPEHNGAFWAPVPGKEKKRLYPSSIAYLADVVEYEVKRLGPSLVEQIATNVAENNQLYHKLAGIGQCPECGSGLVKRDGCKECPECGYKGDCG